MKALGPVLIVIGVIVGLVAVANYSVLNHSLFNVKHMDLIIGIVGAVVAIIGLIMSMMGRRAAA
jgi:uncharacterized membrane protein YeaQ/YmgE (transglycosylase-associated protein family)